MFSFSSYSYSLILPLLHFTCLVLISKLGEFHSSLSSNILVFLLIHSFLILHFTLHSFILIPLFASFLLHPSFLSFIFKLGELHPSLGLNNLAFVSHSLLTYFHPSFHFSFRLIAKLGFSVVSIFLLSVLFSLYFFPSSFSLLFVFEFGVSFIIFSPLVYLFFLLLHFSPFYPSFHFLFILFSFSSLPFSYLHFRSFSLFPCLFVCLFSRVNALMVYSSPRLFFLLIFFLLYFSIPSFFFFFSFPSFSCTFFPEFFFFF